MDSEFQGFNRRGSFKAEYYLLLLIYRILLDFSYNKIVYQFYAYAGFECNINAVLYFVSWVVLILSARVVFHAYVNRENKASQEVVFFLYLMSMVPFSSMMANGALKTDFVIANIVYWTILLFFTTRDRFIKGASNIRFKTGNVTLGDTQLVILAIVLGLVTIYVSGRYARFRLNFNLMDVYELREEASSNDLPTMLQYLFSWGRTINVILIAYFVRKKKYFWTVFCGIVGLLSFGYDGSKSTFFLLVLAVGISLLPKMSMQVINKWVLRGFAVLIFSCAVIYTITGNYVPASMIVRRVLFLPIRIAKEYFDFFTKNPPDYLRQSFLRYFGLSSNYESIPHMIGRIYFDSPKMSANNGLISDAMANLGYFGIVMYPVFISIVFKWLDKSSKNLDPRIYVTVAVYLSLVMTNSFFTTILLTHGLIVAIIVLSMMKREENVTNELLVKELSI